MLVSCHVCGRPRLCHHHPTFLCRQFALVDTEQSPLADGKWSAISPNRHQTSKHLLSCSPTRAYFALPSPPPSISIGPMPSPSATPAHPLTPPPPGKRHGANFRGPVAAGRAQANQNTKTPPAVISEPAFPTRQGESLFPPKSRPAQTLAPRTWPADHAPRSWPVGSSGVSLSVGCLRV